MAMKRATKKSRTGVVVGSRIEEVRRAADSIRQRAYELAVERGFAGDHDLDDWLKAENELFFVPASELRETETQYSLNVSVPGFSPHQIAVSVEPQSVAVWGGAATSDGRKELFCQYRLPHAVVVERAKAFYDSGELTVILPKRPEPREADTEQPAAA
jgi:HSP20 family molecular chaperone IbpA